jgi:ring-1,2-phenylacetyl-CoA epoxidase subunit PaaD
VTRTMADSAEILRLLDRVLDPEVPALSIVELGIVREVTVDSDGVTVTVTPTYSGCPAMYEIERSIRETLIAHDVGQVAIRTVHAPAWTTDWMSEAAREKLRAYGIAPPQGMADADALVPLLGRARAAAIPCPFCDSSDTVTRSRFGSTACKSLHYCNGCRQPFEHFKAF